MPTKTPTKTTPAPAMPSIRFQNPTDREKLARLVLDSPRLLGVIPAEELAPLFTAYTGAVKATDAARLLPAEGANVAAEVDAALRAGQEIDAADLLTRVGQAQVARDHRERTLALLGALPSGYREDIVRVVEDNADAYWTALSADLANLLDRAAVVVADLDGVDNAEDAITEGKATEWATLRGLVQEMAELRRTHAALVRIEEPAAAVPARLVRLYFAGLDDVAQVTEHARTLSGHPVAPPMAHLLETESTAHLLAAVRQRAQLRPHVGRPGTSDAEAAIRDGADYVPTVRDPRTGELVTHYGSQARVIAASFGDRGFSPDLHDFAAAQATPSYAVPPVD